MNNTGKNFNFIQKILSLLSKSKDSKLPSFKITMLGHTGVGKTSLLAAMYDQFEKVNKNLQIIADTDSKNILDKRLKELKSMIGDSIKVQGGIPNTTQIRSYKFKLGETGADPSLELHFQDYPGEYIVQPNKKEEVKDLIRESIAVLIPVDTPPLMEENGKYHDFFNQPKELSDLFKEVYQNWDTPHLVILVPVKCEKYMHDKSELFKKVEEGYDQLLNKLSSDRLISKIAVMITPVETVGSVIFSYLKKGTENNDEYIFYFRKPNPTDPYQPKNSEQPLKYILRFLLKPDNHHKTKVLIKNKSLLNTVSAFSDNHSDGVKIIQGDNFFKL